MITQRNDPGDTIICLPTIDTFRQFFHGTFKSTLQASPEYYDYWQSTQGSKQRHQLNTNPPAMRIFKAAPTSPASLQSVTTRFAICDEIEEYKKKNKTGDTLKQIEARLTTYGERAKMIVASTTGIKGTCAISSEFHKGTEHSWNHLCQECNKHYIPEWKLVTWNTEDPTDCGLACPYCGTIHKDISRIKNASNGAYIAAHPNSERLSIHFDVFSTQQKLSALVKKFIGCVKMEDFKAFYTKSLGKPFDIEQFQKQNAKDIDYEKYTSKVDILKIDNKNVLVTYTSDVQKDRIESLLLAWESPTKATFLKHIVTYGRPDQQDLYERAHEQVMAVEIVRRDGIKLKPKLHFIDSGFQTTSVYAHVANHPKFAFAVKGLSYRTAPLIYPTPKYTGHNNSVALFGINPNLSKSIVYQMLAAIPDKKPDIGFIYPPMNNLEEFFKQATAEVLHIDDKGPFFKAVKNRPAEILDMMGYAVAAVDYLAIDFVSEFERYAKLALQIKKNKKLKAKEHSQPQSIISKTSRRIGRPNTTRRGRFS